jgi:hypothetical protein
VNFSLQRRSLGICDEDGHSFALYSAVNVNFVVVARPAETSFFDEYILDTAR